MDVNDQIRSTLAAHPIVLFMKGTPQLPMDGFSHRAVEALVSAGADFYGVNVLADSQVRAVLPHFSNFVTFPQLFIRGALIGGCDIIEDLHRAGELARIARDVAGPAP